MARYNKLALPADCRALWKSVFNDQEAFMDLYFSRRFSPQKTFYTTRAGKLAAAMQSLPYRMTFGDKQIQVGYVSGLATYPPYRHRGYARRVLHKSLRSLYRRGSVLSILIPATTELYDYYRQSGYAACFAGHLQTISSNSLSPLSPQTLTAEITDFIQTHLRQRPFSVQHSAEDLQDIGRVAALSGGGFYLQRDSQNQILAVAVAERQTHSVIVKDAFGSPRHVASLLPQIASPRCPVLFRTVHPSLPNTPYGMARIVNARKLLETYAALFPQQQFTITICNDNVIPQNNATFRISAGRCTPVAPSQHTYTPDAAAENLLSPLHPVMTMMLD